jgi:SAM-dependent methyltransferase
MKMALLDQAFSLAKMLARGEWGAILYRARVRWYGLDVGYVGVTELGLTDEHSRGYEDSGPVLDRILKMLTVSPTDKILDVGCGKGGAIVTLVRYPFSAVDGIDIAGPLIEIGRENLRRCGVKNSRLMVCDATEFEDLDRYTFLYMYNPFPREVVRRFLQNVDRSMQRNPRRVTVIYYNSLHEDLLEEFAFHLIHRINGERCPAVIYGKDSRR